MNKKIEITNKIFICTIIIITKAASYKAQIRQDYYNAIEGKKDSILQSVFRKMV